MDKKELKLILEEGEGQFIEFKENFDSKNLAKEICAFANAEGGRIFIGVNDKGEIKGIEITNRLHSQIQDTANNCDPSIKIKLEILENILIVNVEEGSSKPYQCSQGFYLRIGANSQKLSRDEIIEFSIGEGKIKFDEQINENFKFPEDFDEDKLNQYMELAGLTKNIPVKEILITLKVAKLVNNEIKLNNAGVLFFAKSPEKFFVNSKVVCVNYKTNEKVDILDKKIFDDGILNNILEAINHVEKHIDVRYEIKTAKRKEIPQFPDESYREAIVNAVMHRDYFDKSGDVIIEIFKNKLIISNPGGLVKWLRPEDFGKYSRARNQIIAELLSKTDYVEKVGSGINRIRDAMKEAGLPAPIFEYNTSFATILLDETGGNGKELTQGLRKINARFTQDLSDKEKEILEFIAKNEKIRSEDCEQFLKISRVTANKYFKMLIKKKLIVQKGGGKYTYYILKNGK